MAARQSSGGRIKENVASEVPAKNEMGRGFLRGLPNPEELAKYEKVIPGGAERILEMVETVDRPKPMVEIGGRPILWHIMKIYSHYGFQEFIICCGYKGHMIKEYFTHYHMYQTNTTFDLSDGGHTDHNSVTCQGSVALL